MWFLVFLQEASCGLYDRVGIVDQQQRVVADNRTSNCSAEVSVYGVYASISAKSACTSNRKLILLCY